VSEQQRDAWHRSTARADDDAAHIILRWLLWILAIGFVALALLCSGGYGILWSLLSI
jgi:hypothetical protein